MGTKKIVLRPWVLLRPWFGRLNENVKRGESSSWAHGLRKDLSWKFNTFNTPICQMLTSAYWLLYQISITKLRWVEDELWVWNVSNTFKNKRIFQTLSKKWKIAFMFASCELKFQFPFWCFGEKKSWHLNFAWVPVTQTWVTHDLIPLDCQSNP